jgi:hypothetical protein
MFFKDVSQVSDTTFIASDKLLRWENSLCVGPELVLKDFYLSTSFPVKSRKFQHVIKLLSNDWSGKVSIFAIESGVKTQLAEYQYIIQ